jgi:hypothetical protein
MQVDVDEVGVGEMAFRLTAMELLSLLLSLKYMNIRFDCCFIFSPLTYVFVGN